MKVVIRVGGSLIVGENGKYDLEFLRDLSENVEKLREKYRIYLVVGGGKFVKRLMKELRERFGIPQEELDMIGIRMTWLNAEIVRVLVGGYKKIITDYRRIPRTRKVVVGGGWKPGVSTDYDAVLLALKVGARKIVKLTDVDGIFDRDPRKFRNARLIRKMSWNELLEMTRGRSVRGFPFDPKASELASRNGLELAVINGKKMENLLRFLEGKKFLGTLVS